MNILSTSMNTYETLCSRGFNSIQNFLRNQDPSWFVPSSPHFEEPRPCLSMFAVHIPQALVFHKQVSVAGAAAGRWLDQYPPSGMEAKPGIEQ